MDLSQVLARSFKKLLMWQVTSRTRKASSRLEYDAPTSNSEVAQLAVNNR